jgi:hypothetical protein
MSENISARDFIEIKTDQLNYEHFLGGSITFKVARIGSKKDQGKKKLLIYMEGHDGTPFVPCMGMIKCLSSPDGWGEKLADWVGRSITLFGDSKVMYGGKEIGGVRVSHISHIAADYVTKIAERRGVRIDYLIRKLAVTQAAPAPAAAYPADQFAAKLPAMRQAIADGKMTAEQVIARCEQTGALTAEQRAQITAPIQAETTEEEIF